MKKLFTILLNRINYILVLSVYYIFLLISKLPFAPNFFISTVVARRYGQAARAKDKQDYESSYGYLKDFETLDFDCPYLSSSHYILGVLYYLGIGTEQDQKRGMTLIKRAAKNGDSDAEKYLKKLRDAHQKTEFK